MSNYRQPQGKNYEGNNFGTSRERKHLLDRKIFKFYLNLSWNELSCGLRLTHGRIILALCTSKNRLKCMKKRILKEECQKKSEVPPCRENREVQSWNCSLPTDYNFSELFTAFNYPFSFRSSAFPLGKKCITLL